MGGQSHTAGPWVVSRDHSAFTMVRAGDAMTGMRIASTFQTHGTKSAEGNLRRIRENEANARLIAAAPELMEALRAFAEQKVNGEGNSTEIVPNGYSSAMPWRENVLRARAAIAKATGESAA